jgi:hypothetical protein
VLATFYYFTADGTKTAVSAAKKVAEVGVIHATQAEKTAQVLNNLNDKVVTPTTEAAAQTAALSVNNAQKLNALTSGLSCTNETVNGLRASVVDLHNGTSMLNANNEQVIIPTIKNLAQFLTKEFPEKCKIINGVFREIET